MPSGRRRRSKSAANKRAWSEVLQASKAYEVPRIEGVNTAAVLADVLGRLELLRRAASQKADEVGEAEFWAESIDAQGNTVLKPNEWYALETALRAEVVALAVKMEELGLAERQLRVAEAVALAFAPLLDDLADRLALNKKQRAKLPEVLEGSLRRLEAAPLPQPEVV